MDGLFWDLLSKLDVLKKGLEKRAKQIKRKREGVKQYLTSKLEELMKEEKDDKNIVELIDTKIGLNFEIEKDEVYWE